MYSREGTLQHFVDATRSAFEQFVQNPDGRRAAAKVFRALEVPVESPTVPGVRWPVCSQLSSALSVEPVDPRLKSMLDGFRAIEPRLRWRRKASHDDTASENFPDGHANAMIIGPEGIEDRQDVWFGVSLLAPHVRYPDHNHPPEEVYLVVSDGEFRQGDGDWFEPGVGGTFYNTPGIVHAMRASNTPLLAFWLLPVE